MTPDFKRGLLPSEIHPTLHPRAAYSNHPEAGVLQRHQVLPLSNHGR